MSQQRINEFRKYFNLEFELIEDWDPAELSKRYVEFLKEGKQEGFHPVFVFWDEQLIEQIDVELGELDKDCQQEEMADLTRRLLLSAHEYVKLDQFFEDRRKEFGEPDLDLEADFDLDEKLELELLEFLHDPDDFEGSPEEADVFDLLLVKIPTTHPEETFAYFPIGGINSIPPSAELVTLGAKWREKYGAVPAVISYDTVEYYVPSPPSAIEDAAELAKEHFLICPDLVWQICDDLVNLTSNLYKNVQWFFWWD